MFRVDMAEKSPVFIYKIALNFIGTIYKIALNFIGTKATGLKPIFLKSPLKKWI